MVRNGAAREFAGVKDDIETVLGKDGGQEGGIDEISLEDSDIR